MPAAACARVSAGRRIAQIDGRSLLKQAEYNTQLETHEITALAGSALFSMVLCSTTLKLRMAEPYKAAIKS
jgi:hypothetical protein